MIDLSPKVPGLAFRPKKILITGGTGFIGAHLVEVLLQEGHEVVVLDNFWTSRSSNLDHLKTNPRLQVIRHDVTLPFPDGIQASQIYHLACPASPRHFTKTPISILETCYQGTKNALDAAQKWSAVFLLASTSEVYGDAQTCPQPESYFGNVNSFGPRSCYDEGKRVAEALVYAYRLESSLDLKIARIFNAYGPGMRETDGRAVSSFVTQALRGTDILINGQGNASRSFQYVGDCVDGLRALMESDWKGGPINIGCETETSIIDLARLVAQRVSELNGGRIVGIQHGDALPDEPVRRRPDCALAKKVLGWSSNIDLAEGLDRTIKWHIQERRKSARASL